MTTFKLWLTFFLASGICSAQSLVPNGNFEDGPLATSVGWYLGVNSSCLFSGSVAGPDYWSVTNLSPDRLMLGTWFCLWDNISAYEGSSHVVLGPGESGMCTLTSTLVAGTVYNLHYCVRSETLRGTSPPGSRLKFKFSSADSLITPFIDTPQWICRDIIFTPLQNSTTLEVAGLLHGTDLDDLSLTEVNPLPVTWLYVRCKKDVLYWATASEINCDYFSVERSGDVSNWDVITKTPCQGNSPSYYNVKVSGEGYYRIKQTDYDGRYIYSKIIYVKGKEEEKSAGKRYNILGQEIK